MIDIHNHILVDIDDGPKTIEKSIALLKQARRCNKYCSDTSSFASEI